MLRGFKKSLMHGDVIVVAVGLGVALAFSTVPYRICTYRRGKTVVELPPTEDGPSCRLADLPVAATPQPVPHHRPCPQRGAMSGSQDRRYESV